MKFTLTRTTNKKSFPVLWKSAGLCIVEASVSKGSGLICEIEKRALLLCFQLQGRTILGKKILRQQEFTIWNKGSVTFRSSGDSNRIMIACSHAQLQKWGIGASFLSGLEEKDLFMDIQIYTDLQELISCDFEKEEKEIFIQGKLLQLISRIKTIANRQNNRRHIRSEYDLERILFARDYLLQNIAIPPSIPQLARTSGINELKLKMGFREVFNNTVYGYLSDTRMEMAKKELSGKKTLTEIAFELGYSSNQHFSMAFKKKFGVAPSQLRK